MSDLISRKALLELIDENYKAHWHYETVEEVFKLITNAPTVEQGEPVAYIHKHYLNEDKNALDWHKREHPQFEMISLYTAPPQPQVVKDAPAVESETSYCGKDYSVGSGGFEKVYVCGEDDGQCGWCKCLDYRSPAVKDALEKAAKICDELEDKCNKFDRPGCGDAIRALIEKE